MQHKIFELSSVLSDLSRTGPTNSAQHINLESLEWSGNNIFVGFSNGGIASYSIQEHEETRIRRFNATEWKRGIIPTKKAVQCIRSASALNRLLVLSDHLLFMVTMEDLQVVAQLKLRYVTLFEINQNPYAQDPFVIQIAVATRKKQILLCDVLRDDVVSLKEVSISDPALCLSFDDHYLCYATEVSYFLHNVRNGENQPLFPYNLDEHRPLIKRIGKEEFLLSGPSCLGMFVDSSGVSRRPPLHWGTQTVRAFAYSQPYVLVLSEESVAIFNTDDQQLKQQISFGQGFLLNDFEGQVFVATRKDIFRLHPVSLDKQIEVLLAARKVSEALDLAETARYKMSSEEFQFRCKVWKQRAAFMYFERQQFEDASQLLTDSDVDIREVISLFPTLLPASSHFTRAQPSLHDMADVDSLCHGRPELKEPYMDFLVDLLQKWRAQSAHQKEVDTALLKLYAGVVEEAKALLTGEHYCDLVDCAQWLHERNMWNCLALVKWHMGARREAMDLWKRLATGSTKDSSFTGWDMFVDCLINCDDKDFLLECLEWLLPQDETAAIKVVTEHVAVGQLPSARLLQVVEPYPAALRAFLWHSISNLNSREETLHTRLALLYLDDIARLQQNGPDSEDDVLRCREQLQQLLRTSSCYRERQVLSRVEQFPMLLVERAMLLGMLGDHEQALGILIMQCKDVDAALAHCKQASATLSRQSRQALYETLLRTMYQSVQERHDDGQFLRMLRVLNSEPLDLDLRHVLQLFPEYWSYGVVSALVRKSYAGLAQYYRQCKMQRMLSESVLTQKQAEKYLLSRDPITLKETSVCAVCQKRFNNVDCFVYPNGTLVHRSCVKHSHMCPITGEVFKFL